MASAIPSHHAYYAVLLTFFSLIILLGTVQLNYNFISTFLHARTRVATYGIWHVTNFLVRVKF